MKRVSLSGLEKSLSTVWKWYVYQSELSLSAKSRIRQQLLAGSLAADPVFFGMTLEEVDDFFRELDLLTILDLLAAAEAAIRVDFLNRAYQGRGSSVAVDFRKLYKKQGPRVRLDEHILETWTKHRRAARSAVSDFRGALKLRHWLAHGRYWTPKFRINYSPGDVFDIASNLLAAID